MKELIAIQDVGLERHFISKESVDALLEKIEKEVMSHVPDISTGQGRTEIKSLAYKVARSKTFLDTMGKDLVAGWKQQAKAVDTHRKAIRDRLDDLKARVREPLTLWEKEKAEIEKRDRIAAAVANAWDLATTENELFDMKREQARIAAEAEAKAKAEELERQRKEHEARIRREAMEKAERDAWAKIEAEKQARERAEREKIEAEAKAKAEQEAAVRDAEARVKAEAEAKQREKEVAQRLEREAAERASWNKAHRKTIRNAATFSLTELGWPLGHSKELVDCIERGLIDHVTLNF